MGGTKPKEDRVMLAVEHVQQRHTWDCGLACVNMVLPPVARIKFSSQLYEICQEEGFGKSTWSIDLAYLLQRFGIKHRYMTITLGVDPGFSSETFYDHVLHKDAQRVTERFHAAKDHGVVVEQGTASINDILSHLYQEGPVILLTNAHLLVCVKCVRGAMPQLRSCFPCTPPYQGHYVLLIGFDMKNSHIYYRNPSFGNRICTISFAKLDKARRSYGTDEDIIFIYNYHPCECISPN